MRAHALKQHDHYEEPRAKYALRLVSEVKVIPVHIADDTQNSVDYEAFMAQYGLWSDFA